MKNKNLKISYYILIGLIICTGAFIRLWQLDSIPPGIQYDEAHNGLDAVEAMENNDYKIFYNENNGREGLYINLLAFSFKAFGVNIQALKLVSVLFGIFTLLGFYFLLKQFRLSRLSIILALFCFSFSFWHIIFSRLAYRGIMVPFLLVWIFYFFYKGLYAKKQNLRYLFFILSGLLTGTGLHTYISFRVVPLIFVLIIGFYLFLYRKSFIKKYWKGALFFFFAALITAAPMIWFFYNEKDQLIGRSNQVSIFNQTEMSPLKAFGKSLLYHLGSFSVHGDPNQRHNHLSYPMLPAAWGVLFVFGFVLSIKEIFLAIFRKTKNLKRNTRLAEMSFLAQGIFWVMLIPGVLTTESIPHTLRIIGVIPSTFLFIALPFEYMVRLFKKIKNSNNIRLKIKRWIILKISLTCIILLVIFSGFLQVLLYFSVWPNHPRTASSFEKEMVIFGKVVKNMPTKKYNLLITAEDTGIAPNRNDSTLKSAQFMAYPEIKKYIFWKPGEALKSTTCEDALYVFYEADEWLIRQFEKKCPDLKTDKINYEGYNFWIMR